MTDLVCANVGTGFEKRERSSRMWFLPLLWPFKDGHKRKPTALLNWVQYLSEPSLKNQFPFTSEREKTKPAPTFFKYLANQISCLAAMIPLTRLCLLPLSLLSSLADKPSNNCLKRGKKKTTTKPTTQQKIHHPFLKLLFCWNQGGGKEKCPNIHPPPKTRTGKVEQQAASNFWMGPCLADPTIIRSLCKHGII